MKVALFFLAAAALLLSTLPAEGHHSFGGTYNVDKQITIKGKMVQVSLRSPHSFFFVETQDAFKIGDTVEVVANPARSPNSTRARLLKITRTTDGKTWGSGTGETVD